MSFCSYYQAKVDSKQTWFVTATLRSFENLTFDRAVEGEKDIFEFFVPQCLEEIFLKVMKYYIENNMVTNLEKLPNRFLP